MKPQETPSEDDPSISDAEVLLRHCKTASQLSRREDGTYIFSDAIFASNGGGCSVEIESLVTEAGETAKSRCEAHNAFAVVALTAREVRELKYKGPGSANSKPVELTGLKVAYTPIPADKPYGPNPYHADIFPGPSSSASRALTKLRKEIIPIDQERAALEYAKKFPPK